MDRDSDNHAVRKEVSADDILEPEQFLIMKTAKDLLRQSGATRRQSGFREARK
jgi:hypothetical protein